MRAVNKVKKFVMAILTLIILLSVSLAVTYYNRNDPFVYITMLWVSACILIILISKSNLRLLALYAGTAMLAFGLYEAYLAGWFSEQNPKFTNFSISNPSYFQSHSILGYSPKKDIQVRAKKSYRDEALYDVQYTIDSNGLRIGPNNSKDGIMSVLFFGGSITFGEGVNDQEAMPYRFEEKSNGRFKAFNFGFHGYGPHQMLAILENEMEKPIVKDNPPQYAIYQAIPSHVIRCRGRAFWDKSGPNYVLDEQGEAVYGGPFHNFIISNFIQVMARSIMIRRWLSAYKDKEISDMDIDLFGSIVKKSENIFMNRYGGKFYVLLWPGNTKLFKRILSKLKRKQISIIKIEDVLSDYKIKKEKYRIRLPYAYHPNKLAHETIAENLIKLLNKTGGLPVKG